MALSKIHLRPGVTVEFTPTLNEAGFSQSQLVRFFAGQVQKLGGWVSIPVIAKLAGICRGLFGWADLVGTAHVAAGTEQRLYVLTGGALSDITPVVFTSDIAPAIATTAGLTAAIVTDAGYPPSVGDWVNIVTWVSRGGLIFAGFYRITGTSGTTYTIDAGVPATATQASGGTVPSYTTSTGSSVVTVALTAHGLSVGSVYQATVSTVVSGLTISGGYIVNTVVDANSFQIAASGVAAGVATVAENAGNMRIQYLLPSGVRVNTASGGWGSGDWGGGDWGTTSAGDTSPLVNLLRTWSLDHFGQDLIAAPNLGKIYHWSPPDIAPAVVIDASAPTINCVVFSIAQAQIIIACGTEAAGSYFPTLIRWCDSGDFTDWVATVTNQAGSFQLPSGSYVSAAMAVGFGALIWTDADLWSVTYQGLPFVFSFNQIAVACEALSKKAPAAVGQMVVWPSSKSFFRYANGSVTPMDCPVWDFFFDNLDLLQTDAVCSAVNTLFNEVAWYFPFTESSTVGYVKWNYSLDTWDYGTLTRTAWVDHSPYGNPIGSDDQGMLFMHETSADADGMALDCFAQSGYYDLADGDQMQVVKVIIPDFVASAGANIQITALATDYPGDPPRSYGPFTVTPQTRRLNVSLRGRQVAFRIGSSDLGSFWRMGAIRYSSKNAGSRP